MSQRAKAKTGLILVLSVVAVCLILSVEKAARALWFQTGPTVHELTLALTRAGLEPKALTAAGVSPSAASTVVDNVFNYMVEHPGALSSADQAFGQARASCEALEGIIQSGKGTPQQVADYNAAKAARLQAQADQAAALNALATAGTANLSDSQKAVLAKIRGNGGWDVPTEFQSVDRTEAQWVQLRNALVHERIAAKKGESVDADVQALLSQARGDSTVAIAAANLGTNLVQVETSWEQSISN